MSELGEMTDAVGRDLHTLLYLAAQLGQARARRAEQQSSQEQREAAEQQRQLERRWEAERQSVMALLQQSTLNDWPHGVRPEVVDQMMRLGAAFQEHDPGIAHLYRNMYTRLYPAAGQETTVPVTPGASGRQPASAQGQPAPAAAAEEPTRRFTPRQPSGPPLTGEQEEVAGRLRAYRAEQAAARGFHHDYLVFNQDTLTEIARRQPATLEDLEAIRGIGPAKIRAFGEGILNAVHPQAATAPEVLEPATGPALSVSAPYESRLRDINQAAAQFYTAAYPGSPAAAYLAERLGTDLVGDSRFTVGFAPDKWTALTDHLRSTMGATDAELIDAGLSRRAPSGNVIDVFRNRALFAYKDADGNVVGWTGRALPGSPETAPKYYNTPATALFNKSELLFGVDNLRPGDTVPVRVEGPIDAIAVTIAGETRPSALGPEWGSVTPVGVAPSGTAFTEGQVRLLQPSIDANPRVVVAVDNDEAGWKAARKDFTLLTGAGAEPSYVGNPAAKDPAEWYGEGVLPPDDRRSLAYALYVGASDQATGLHTALALRQAEVLREHNKATLHPDRWAELQAQGGLDVGQEVAIRAYAEDLALHLPSSGQMAGGTTPSPRSDWREGSLDPDPPAAPAAPAWDSVQRRAQTSQQMRDSGVPENLIAAQMIVDQGFGVRLGEGLARGPATRAVTRGGPPQTRTPEIGLSR